MKELKFDTSVPKIDCKYIKQKRMYLNAKGRVWPCCHLQDEQVSGKTDILTKIGLENE